MFLWCSSFVTDSNSVDSVGLDLTKLSSNGFPDSNSVILVCCFVGVPVLFLMVVL